MVKSTPAAGQTPDVRPVAGLERELVAITHYITQEVRDAFEDICSPQQVQAMEGGISSVIHGARTLLELRPNFIAVKLDMTRQM